MKFTCSLEVHLFWAFNAQRQNPTSPSKFCSTKLYIILAVDLDSTGYHYQLGSLIQTANSAAAGN